VTLLANGNPLILDPQNGYALLEQDLAGRYLNNLGSVHYHLELTQFMAQDSNGRLLFSHPGDSYDPRQSIRVADQELTPVLEFGEQGAGSGQFNNPAGVAAWGAACSVEGPYNDDPQSLLLLHFDGSYDGAQGEPGSASGTEFVPARYQQGVYIDAGDSLSYQTAGNFDPAQGSIEFWLRPDWEGGDGQEYAFFEVGDEWQNRMRLMKDGANNLRFMVWDASNEYGVAYNVSHWQAGEWHHIAATWQDTSIALFVDGVQVGQAEGVTLPVINADSLQVGSCSVWYPLWAQAVIDELRISSQPRLGNSLSCNRILVADSGNHRLQAFDSLGGFLSQYGSSGSGPGQFNTPLGMAVDSAGRVLVVDSGNDRIVVLGFDGINYTYLTEYTSGLNAPTGLALSATDNLYIADTGNHRIVELAPDGQFSAEYTAPNDGSPGNFSQPRGLAVTLDGTLIVADTGNARVVRLLPPIQPWYTFIPLLVRTGY
jgi:hypothetical protein